MFTDPFLHFTLVGMKIREAEKSEMFTDISLQITHSIYLVYLFLIIDQTWPNCGPRAACGPPNIFCGP